MRYDPFQEKAIDYINEGHSVIVSAPTGAGKTAIAEHVIENCLKRREKAIYTAPIKALSNQKFRDFNKKYPEQVGILTGDVTINANAPMLIMTTEIFRNKILEEQSAIKDFRWVIFDELHYLDDMERGSVWEESLIFLPKHMNILGLSATIPNIKELAGWFESIHQRPLKIIIESKRPVPLHFFFQCENKIYENIKDLKPYFAATHYKQKRIPRDIQEKTNRVSTLINHFNARQLLPCIYFCFGRRRTEYLAKELKVFNFLKLEEKEMVTEQFKALCEKFDIAHESSTYEMMPLIEKGIAYHHAGMLPTLKEVIEQLFTTKLIKVIFTTETFALGVNMPAKTVAFDELEKFYGDAYRPLKTRDFYQMAGRAGRRSIDTEGFVFCRVNPYDVTPDDIQRIIYSDPEMVTSRFNTSYATLLNLYEKHGEKLYDIYPLSFHYFQQKQFLRKQALNLIHAKIRLLKELGHIRKHKLTEKGLFAGKLYGYELLLAELHEEGVLERLSAKELGVLAVSMVYEPRKGIRKPTIPYQFKNLQRLTNDLTTAIHRMEYSFKIQTKSKGCFFHLAKCVDAWMNGEPFNKILTYTETDEGEIVRYFRMGIQVLREILEADISDALKQKAYTVINKINRDVIDAEKLLRG